MSIPEQRHPSREECCREAGAWWDKYRSAPNQIAASLAYGHCEAWLGLLWEQMDAAERAEVELRPVDEPIAYG